MTATNSPNQLSPISEEELQRNLPKRRIGLVGWAIIAAIFLVLLPVTAFALWHQAALRRFETEMNELAASQPVSAAGMDAYYALPNDIVDCTPLYRSVANVMGSATFKSDMVGIAFVDIEDTPSTKIGTWKGSIKGRKLLDAYEPELEKLYKACRQGGAARYPIKFEDGFLTLLEHVDSSYRFCPLLYLDSWVNAHESNSAGVSRALRAAFSTARSLEYEPVLVSQNIQLRRAESTVDELEKLLPIVDFTDLELHALQLEIRKFDLRKSLRRGFVGEQGMCIVALQNADREQIQMGSERGKSGLAEWAFAKLGSRFDDLLLYTECNKVFTSATDEPWITAIETVNTTISDTRKKTDGRFGELRYSLTRICLSVPDYPGNQFVMAATTDTKLKLMDVLLAIKRFQGKHGRLPNDASKLVPDFLDELPLDPCHPRQVVELNVIDGDISVSSVGLPEEPISKWKSNFNTPPPTGPITMKLHESD